MASDVILVTRVQTFNKGNQALSEAWADAVRNSGNATNVGLVERVHRFLTKFTVRDIEGADPFRNLDALATRVASLIDRYPSQDTPLFSRTRLDETIKPPVSGLRRLRTRLKVGSYIARAGFHDRSYAARISAFRKARAVIVNPAGEISKNVPDMALRYLIEALVAKKLGARVAFINHTFEYDHPTLQRLILPLYEQFDLVGFRDEISIEEYRRLGGGPAIMVPDLAFMTSVDVADVQRRPVVGLAFNAAVPGFARQASEWMRMVRELGQRFTVELISNELPTDRPELERFSRETGAHIAGWGLDYQQYARHLAQYRFVVTSRMHTGILGMTVGTPVVFVDPGGLKVRGVARLANLNRPVHSPESPGWADRALAECAEVDAEWSRESTLTRDAVARVRSLIEAPLAPALATLLA